MLQWKTQFKGKVKRWHLFYEYKSDINGTGGLQRFLVTMKDGQKNQKMIILGFQMKEEKAMLQKC